MDDTSGIRLLAGLVDILRDKDGSAKLLNKLQAHEDAAADSLAQAQAHKTKATETLAESQALQAESARLRNEMLTNLKPREDEVARGAKLLQQFQKDTEARDKDISAREVEMTRRENAAAAREEKLGRDQDTLEGEKKRVAAMKATLETRLANLKKAASG